MKFQSLVFLVLLPCCISYSQMIDLTEKNIVPVDVNVAFKPFKGTNAIEVTKNQQFKGVDQPTFAKVKDVSFKDGVIELKVLSSDENTDARGFIGVAFRINEDNSKYECFYLRPGNARSDDQLRRNHTLQYYSYPDYPFSRTRQETPGKYESYRDMALNEWIKMKIVVKANQAKLFINDDPQPSLIVNDLKLGSDATGSIAFWVDMEAKGYFSDVKISDSHVE